MQKLICPLCGEKRDGLLQHLMYEHRLTRNEIKKKYPTLKLQNDNRKKENLICEHCGKLFSYQTNLKTHIKKIHPEFYVEKKEEKQNIKRLECKICKKKIANLSQHIFLTHNIEWDDYCKKYNYSGPKMIMSEKHKQSLSEQKLKFYKSERGIKWREWNSERYSGENNPACKPETKKKISDSAIKRTQESNNPFFSNSFGIQFNFQYNNVKYRTRSFEEFKCVFTLLENNITFKYENFVLKYRNEKNEEKNYLIDLFINDTYVEIKGDSEKNILKMYENCKYKEAKRNLNNYDKKYYIFNYNLMCEYLNIKEISNKEIYKKIKILLDNDNCKITQVVINRKIIPRTLKMIDSNWETNKNIKFIVKGDKK